MAKFKYVGDPNDKFSGPDTISAHGLTFQKGQVVDVDEEAKDSKGMLVVDSLAGNSHFVDMSDKDEKANVEARQKVLEKAEQDREKAAEAQRKKDEADAKAMERNREKAPRAAVTAENAPRPPGTVTREPLNDAFGGRTVEQRTAAEDHTKAGKTKS